VIRNAVIHINNEQPLVADLLTMPAPGDLGLLCTNLRTLSGKRPIFADHMESVFFVPYAHIRFVEIPPGSEGAPALPAGAATEAAVPAAEVAAAPEPEPEADLEIDEDFLRRIRDV
jgi:hypothetical protein